MTEINSFSFFIGFIVASTLSTTIILLLFFKAKDKETKLKFNVQTAEDKVNSIQNELELKQQGLSEQASQLKKLNDEVKLYIQEKTKNDELKKHLGEVKEALAAENLKNDLLIEEKAKNLSQIAQLETEIKEQKSFHNRLTLEQEKNQKALKEAFQSISLENLQKTNRLFLNMAKGEFEKFHEKTSNHVTNKEKAISDLITPIGEGLQKVESSLAKYDKERTRLFAEFSQNLNHMTTASQDLKKETQILSKALSSPQVRGQWGEMQLKRVVELSGMTEHIDFTTQDSISNLEEEKQHRPDMTIHLPQGKKIIVDAKTPLKAFLEAQESESHQEKAIKLEEHSKHLKNHLYQLGSKKYWRSIGETVEFVILFLPGETIFHSALEKNPDLIEFGIQKKVIIASPTTLLALLLTISHGWRQENFKENAEVIRELGKHLYQRLIKYSSHLNEMKKGIEKTLQAYNQSVGTFESRVLVTARKINELGAGNKEEIPLPLPIDTQPRKLHMDHTIP